MDNTDKTENTEEFVERRYSSTLLGVVNTVEWVIIALILAFVFRAFVMEAFRIPTGSMAETLRGAHHHLRCEQCGYKSDLGTDSVGSGGPKCPSCGFTENESISKMSSNGDRILVLKCIYEFCDPKRWDVVVFKYPVIPTENYIKRLIGLPGEKIECLDGDFYAVKSDDPNAVGKILRKPPKVQNELWMPVYNNDYQPVAATGQAASKEPFQWRQPFVNQQGGKWLMNPYDTTYFTLDSQSGDENTIFYDPEFNDEFRAYFSYNVTIQYRIEPLCTDLKIRFYVHGQNEDGFIGAGLRKYDSLFRGRVNFKGQMVIDKVVGDETIELVRKDIANHKSSRGVLFEFSCVDRQLVMEFGKEKLKYDLGEAIDDMSFIKTEGSLVEVSGAGKLKLSHVAVYRDSYYTNNESLRVRPGKSFTLGEDEFFVCGDNSPESYDGRKWHDSGEGNNGKVFTAGTVPREYLMGKAFFLYWGDSFMPFGSKVPIIPNFSEMKFIYGGSDQEL